MTNAELKKLLNLPRNEKLKIVHTLWDNIAKDKVQETTYPEHIEIIKRRLKKIRSGKTRFNNWETLKNKYNEKTQT